MADFNPHEYLQYISSHPHDPAPPITVTNYLSLRVHYRACEECYKAVNKVAQDETKDSPPPSTLVN